MSELVQFLYQEQPVRTVANDDGVIWFVAADVCGVLAIAHHRDAVARLDEDERGSVVVDTLGGRQQAAAVSESGLYHLTFLSRKPEAVAFRRWVTMEVLPAIRRQGFYELPGQLSAPRVRQAARDLVIAEHDRKAEAGEKDLREHEFRDLARVVVDEHREWLVAITSEYLHTLVYHPWLRNERKPHKLPDPEQPELFRGYTVMREGRERSIPRDALQRAEKLTIIGWHRRMRDAMRKGIEKLLRHDRAMIDEHNKKNPTEAFNPTEIAAVAPDCTE